MGVQNSPMGLIPINYVEKRMGLLKTLARVDDGFHHGGNHGVNFWIYLSYTIFHISFKLLLCCVCFLGLKVDKVYCRSSDLQCLSILLPLGQIPFRPTLGTSRGYTIQVEWWKKHTIWG